MPVASAVRTLIDLNCQWPGFRSTQKTASPWDDRRPLLARAVAKSEASLLIAQELGHDEAAELFHDLGSSWHYQRSGLNVCGWREPEWSLVGDAREWGLSSFGQMARTLLAIKVMHRDGQYVWLAGSHLAAAASDLSPDAAVKARATQAHEIAKVLDGYRQIVLGADLNSRVGDSLGPRSILRSGGWTADVDQTTVQGLDGDAKHGIDAVLTKRRARIKSARILPLGPASDHDARVVTFTTIN